MRHIMFAAFAVLIFAALPAAARAEDFVLTLSDHRFSPRGLQVPVYTKVTVTIRNLDITAAEIGSAALKIDPVLLNPGSQIVLKFGPLNPGAYDLFDAFHNDTDCELLAR